MKTSFTKDTEKIINHLQMTTLLSDPFSYLTTWSLLVSYSIFIWTLLLGSPRWLFLFASCFLTTTSILGTFFLCIPNAKNEADKRKVEVKQIILEDILIHIVPLIIFLMLFGTLSKRTVGIMGTWDYAKILIVVIIIIFSYLGYIRFQQVYYYDYFTLVILTICIFISSFQVHLAAIV